MRIAQTAATHFMVSFIQSDATLYRSSVFPRDISQETGLHILIANQRLHPMIARAETSKLHLLAVFDLLGIAISPFQGYLGLGICINEDIEGTIPIQHGQERDGCGDLSKDGLNLALNLLFSFLGRLLACSSCREVSICYNDVHCKGGDLYSGVAFSSSAVPLSFVLDGLPNICTCHAGSMQSSDSR